jgi:DnaK suppressor protein
VVKKAVVKKAVAKKAVAKKAVVKKAVVKKAVVKKAVAKKAVVKKTVAKKTAIKKTAVKKTVVEKVKKRLTPRERSFQSIRDILIQQKADLLSEAENAMNALPEQTVFPDLGDQASAETDRNFMLRLRGREQRLINKIEEAMERIDTGKFGLCEMCGEEITVARLKARPVATLCIDCKIEQEEEEKLQGQ